MFTNINPLHWLMRLLLFLTQINLHIFFGWIEREIWIWLRSLCKCVMQERVNRGSLFKLQRLGVSRGSGGTCSHFLLQRGKSEGRINFCLSGSKEATWTHPQTLLALFWLCLCESMCFVGVLLLLLLLEWRFFRSLTLSLSILAACFLFLFPASPPRLSSHTLQQTLVSLLQSSYRSSTVQRCGFGMPLDSSAPETLWPHVGVMRKLILYSGDRKPNNLQC